MIDFKFSRRTLDLLIIMIAISIPYGSTAQIEPIPESTALSSEAPTLRFTQLSLEDGMTQASGNNMMQDKDGYLWIATQGGLHRYDGYEFKVFNSTPFDTTSLSDSWVWMANEASNGDLWVTTERGGLNRLNTTTGRAIHYRHDPDDSTSISSSRTFWPLEASNGDLWVSTLDGGLNRMRFGEDGKFTRFQHNTDDYNSISSNVLFGISEDHDNNIWVSSANGINRVDPETEQITRYLNDPSQSPGYGNPLNVHGLYFPPGEQDIIWLATGNGLVRLESESGNYKRYLIEPNKDEINPLNFIHEVMPDPNDNNVLWVGGPGTGIGRFDMRTQEFTSYRNDPNDQHSLRENNVSTLMLDRSGMMWVGTTSEGINAFNPGAVNFTNVRHIPEDPNSLAPGNVWGVYEDSYGTLWVGTDVGSGGDYLTEFNAESREVTWHRHNPNDPNTLLPGSLRAFAEDANGKFWVAGSSGLSLFDRKTGKVRRFLHELIPENRGRNLIFALIPTSEDPENLWIGSGRGLDLFNTRTEVFTTIPLTIDSANSNPVIFSMLEDKNGDLWMGTDDGLFLRESSGKVTLASAYNPLDTTRISDNWISSIVERSREPGILWLSMTNNAGLNRYDTKTGIATHITTENGLADNTTYGILEDENGTLWISTNGGISNYDPDTKQMRNYGLEDGLMALEYNQNAFSVGGSGMLYFGSGKGLTTFAPERLRTNETPPQVVISDVKLFNKSISTESDTQLNNTRSAKQKLELNYDENELTFDFVALHFSNAKKNQYAYQLEGFEEKWVDAGTKRTATYTNLAPGSYTFRVKAANADGIWNEEGTSIHFIVSPPWYRTWWAYILFAVLLAAAVFAVDRIQRSRLNRIEQERAVLREAELRAEAENKRRADTEELSKIGRAITSSLSMEKIIDTVYENVNALMDASVFGVGVYNKKENQIDFPATKEEGKALPAFSYPMDEKQWLAARSFIHSEEIIIADFEKEHDDYLSSYTAPLAGKSPKSILYLPLVHQGNTIGVITTQSFTANAYTEYHINLLRNLANYAAIAMDNASAYRKLDSTISELQSTQEQLVHSEKMASLGELTAGIAHEIQNPLNFVNNFSEVNSELIEELLEEIDKGNTKEVAEIANDLKTNETKIVEHGERASSIVKGMLQHSRTSSGEKEETDINAMSDEYVRLAYHGLRAKDKSFNASFEVDLDKSLPKVNAVPQDIGRVLLNLINNAFHACTERGRSAEAERLSAGEAGGRSAEAEQSRSAESGYKPSVTVSTKTLKDKIEITVSDNGSGIPDDIKDKIFQPFFTTKSAGEGTGLGLSMSYDIITKGHGGELIVNSTMHKGTEFIIILPINS